MAQVFFIPPKGSSGRLSLGQAQLHPHVLPDVAQRPRAAHAKRLTGLAGLTGHHRHQQPAAGEEAAERGEKGDGDGREESARSSEENGGKWRTFEWNLNEFDGIGAGQLQWKHIRTNDIWDQIQTLFMGLSMSVEGMVDKPSQKKRSWWRWLFYTYVCMIGATWKAYLWLLEGGSSWIVVKNWEEGGGKFTGTQTWPWRANNDSMLLVETCTNTHGLRCGGS